MVTAEPNKLDRILEQVPTFSLAAQEALKQFGEQQTDIQRLAQTLETEPSLVAQVLRVANSPFYGLSGKIKSIRESCMVLGQHTLRNLILAAAVSEVLDKLDSTQDDFVNNWNHCVHTATIASQLAKQLKQDSDSSYTAGLLHDIGTLIVSALLPEEMARIKEKIAEGVSHHDAECAVLGLDHAQLAGVIAKQWNLPEDISEAICAHHIPKDNEQALVGIIYIADVISEWMSKSEHDVQQLIEYIERDVMQRLGLSVEALSQFIEKVPSIEETCANQATAA